MFWWFYLVLFGFFKTRPAVIARYAVYVCDATCKHIYASRLGKNKIKHEKTK